MPPATLFLTVCDRTTTPVNHASSFARAAGPKFENDQYNTQIFLELYARSSRPGVTSSVYCTMFNRGCPCSTELKNVLNSLQSSQHTHSIAAGCKNGILMKPPCFATSFRSWISLPNGVTRFEIAVRPRNIARGLVPISSGIPLCLMSLQM